MPVVARNLFSHRARFLSTFAIMALILGLLGAVVMPTGGDETANAANARIEIPANILAADEFIGGYENAITEQIVTLEYGDSLGPLLQEQGIEPPVAYEVTNAMADVYSPRLLKAGQDFTLYRDADGTLRGVTFKPEISRQISISLVGDDYMARDIAIEFPKEIVTARGSILNSLYLDAQSLGVPDKVTLQFSHIFAYSVDFQRDIRDGDTFEMTFEVYRDRQGNPIKAGDLIYASFSPSGKTSSYYLFEKEDGTEGYYDENGKTARRMLMRTPVSGARMSSRFGYRTHPIQGYRKLHKGVDFAAPTGTPVMAGGTGVVVKAQTWGGYGKYIRIRHSDGYETAYAHLSRIAVKPGERVIQGEIIGYVGSTGNSTGPHLHYEVLKDGKQVNPMTLRGLSGKPLEDSERPAFDRRMHEINEIRDTAPFLKVPAQEPGPLVVEADISDSAEN